LGAHVVEAFIALILYGIFVAQVYVYFMNSNNDRFYMKSCVGCIAVLETVHSGFVIRSTYHYVIDTFGNLPGLAIMVWSAGVSELLSWQQPSRYSN